MRRVILEAVTAMENVFAEAEKRKRNCRRDRDDIAHVLRRICLEVAPELVRAETRHEPGDKK